MHAAYRAAAESHTHTVDERVDVTRHFGSVFFLDLTLKVGVGRKWLCAVELDLHEQTVDRRRLVRVEAVRGRPAQPSGDQRERGRPALCQRGPAARTASATIRGHQGHRVG